MVEEYDFWPKWWNTRIYSGGRWINRMFNIGPKTTEGLKGATLVVTPFFNNTIIRLYIILYGDIIEWRVRFWCYFSFIKCPQPTTIINWKAYYTVFLLCQKVIFLLLPGPFLRSRTIGLYIIYYFSIMLNASSIRGTYMYLICESIFWFIEIRPEV